MNFGSMPNDGGFLLLSEEEKEDIIKSDSKSQKLIKNFVGADDFIKGIKKYCIWINEEDLNLAKSILPIIERVNNVKKNREKSSREATKKLSIRPHSFGEIRHQDSESIIIPRHSSERREYIPIGFLDNNSIIADSALAVYNATPWLFGILHSKMHMVWVDAVGGKLETRYRYSAKLCYNTFPFPDISEKQKLTINEYVFAILDERAKYPEKTMAWLYNPETMPKELKQAHQNLDRAIEEIYRMGNPFTSDAERLEHLFKRYDEMTKKDTLFAKQKITRKKTKI